MVPLAQFVEEQLKWDDRIFDNEIEVDSSDGHIRLRGIVPSYSERIAAEQDAYTIPGVKSVENDLHIKFKDTVVTPTDGDVKESYDRRLTIDQRINEEDIQVNVDKGVVTLNGTVDAYWKKEAAAENAFLITGVTGVINNIAVAPSERTEDKKIEEDLRNAMARSSQVKENNIKVNVRNGIVDLKGAVSNYAEAKAVREIAYFTTGVTDVKSNLNLTYA